MDGPCLVSEYFCKPLAPICLPTVKGTHYLKSDGAVTLGKLFLNLS